MVDRNIKDYILKTAPKMPVTVLAGPRQSGKTTLAKKIFENHKYVNLEYPENREFAINDPRGFINTYNNGIIIDEIQHVPQLLSYIQAEVDKTRENGKFVLTGSHNLLMQQAISQSLAGRALITTLLPFSINELGNAGLLPKTFEELLFQGFYPRLYDQKLSPNEWLPSYIQTYIERDVRQLSAVHDLRLFTQFITLCASYTGQLVNFNSMSSQLGVSDKTIKAWLSILESCYIVFLLNPYHNNFKKRVVKTPKLYFYDTGIVCNLLRIRSVDDLTTHHMKGELYENMIIADMLKQQYNKIERPDLYFWRDSHGIEIDCVMERNNTLNLIEIKSAKTINNSFFGNFNKLENYINKTIEIKKQLFYGGDEISERFNCKILNWKYTNISE